MRDAAMIFQVLNWSQETDHEVQVGRGAGEKARGDAPRQRARRRILRHRRPGEQRSRQGVRERVQLGQGSRNQVLASSRPGKLRTITPRFAATRLMKSLDLRASAVR